MLLMYAHFLNAEDQYARLSLSFLRLIYSFTRYLIFIFASFSNLLFILKIQVFHS